MSLCTCAVCGEEFTTLANFDRHQDVDYSRRPAVQCLPPQTVGLVRDARQRWHAPGSAAGREHHKNLAAKRGTTVVEMRV